MTTELYHLAIEGCHSGLGHIGEHSEGTDCLRSESLLNDFAQVIREVFKRWRQVVTQSILSAAIPFLLRLIQVNKGQKQHF